MRRKAENLKSTVRDYRPALACAAILAAACIPFRAAAQQAGQKTFSSPEKAAEALYEAAQGNDEKVMLLILGKDAKQILETGNPEEDAAMRTGFVLKYKEMHRLVREPDGSVILYVGARNWPTPIPLASKGNAWYFDTEAGKSEILLRRIGRNELSTIDVCQQLAAAQKEFYSAQNSRYAEKGHSDEGQHNGLFWKSPDNGPQSPIGPLLASAIADEPARRASLVPFQGYYYEILTRQGKNAPAGPKSYVVDGKMTGGFAFLAYPAEYKSSGVMTFLIGEDGVVYQKDLGRKTPLLVKAIKEYNPDSTWQKVEEPQNDQTASSEQKPN